MVRDEINHHRQKKDRGERNKYGDLERAMSDSKELEMRGQMKSQFSRRHRSTRPLGTSNKTELKRGAATRNRSRLAVNSVNTLSTCRWEETQDLYRKRKHSESNPISEWAAAIPSNAKPEQEPDSVSKRRTLSQIQVPAVPSPIRQSEPSKTTSKKARRDEDLPNYIEPKWFRYTFVSTYIAFVSQTLDPWHVPVQKAVDAMQKIWDATSPFEFKIARSTPVYRKTVQHCADSWRRTIGSTGISTLLAFFDSHEHLRDSDEARQEFAKDYIEQFRFVYENSDHEEVTKWNGVFRSPLVVMTFAAHLKAIEGAQEIPALHDSDEVTHAAIGGLCLAAASVERALILVVSGALTIAMARSARGKAITLPRTLNRSTGKTSTRVTGFNGTTWGKATRGYAIAARKLPKAKLEAIIKKARVYVKSTRACGSTDSEETLDERACLPDGSDSDEE